MGYTDRYVANRGGAADHALRCELLAAAQGEDREAAMAALESLRRVYHLRLPLVEARLGMDGEIAALPLVARNDEEGEVANA